MIRKLFLALGIAMLMGTCFASSAFASIQIAVQTASYNGGARTLFTGGSGSDFSFISGGTLTFGDFSVQGWNASSTNGVTVDLISTSLRVTRNSGAASKDTIHIWITQNNYTLPSGSPVVLESGLSGTKVTGSPTYANIFQGWLDSSNALFGTPGAGNGLQTASGPGVTYDTGSAFGSYARSGMYSLTGEANIELSVGDSTSITETLRVTATPVPAGVVLAGMGIAVVGGVNFLRRRKVANVA